MAQVFHKSRLTHVDSAIVVTAMFGAAPPVAASGLFGGQSASGLFGAPPPARHETISCDGCGATPIVGIRYRCSQCANYDLCETCIVRYEKYEINHGPDQSRRVRWKQGGCLLTKQIAT